MLSFVIIDVSNILKEGTGMARYSVVRLDVDGTNLVGLDDLREYVGEGLLQY